MLNKVFKVLFHRWGAKQIKKSADNNPEVKMSLFSLHKAGNDLNRALRKHEEEYGKYFKENKK